MTLCENIFQKLSKDGVVSTTAAAASASADDSAAVRVSARAPGAEEDQNMPCEVKVKGRWCAGTFHRVSDATDSSGEPLYHVSLASDKAQLDVEVDHIRFD